MGKGILRLLLGILGLYIGIKSFDLDSFLKTYKNDGIKNNTKNPLFINPFCGEIVQQPVHFGGLRRRGV